MLYGELFNQYKGKITASTPRILCKELRQLLSMAAIDQKDMTIAEQFNINKTYIKTILKTSGLPPMRYWRSLRSGQIIAGGRHPCLSTALAVGYDNPPSSPKSFGNTTAVCPPKYETKVIAKAKIAIKAGTKTKAVIEALVKGTTRLSVLPLMCLIHLSSPKESF